MQTQPQNLHWHRTRTGQEAPQGSIQPACLTLPRTALYGASVARLQGEKVPGAISSWLRSGSTGAPKHGDWELLLF